MRHPDDPEGTWRDHGKLWQRVSGEAPTWIGCVVGHGTDFPALDLRALVRAEMIRQHGQGDGAQAALARRMAPRWGISALSAECKLSRWLGRAKGWDMKTDALGALLGELGLDVVRRSS